MIGFALRYLWFVASHPAGTLVLFAAATFFGLWVIFQARGGPAGGEAFALVLLLQMFAASTGFSRLANRGHYDPLLVRGITGWRIAVAHWLVSGLPGMAAWYVLALAELTLSGSGGGVGFAAPGLMSLFLVTTLAWAVTLPLPQLSGGLLWLLAIVALVITPAGTRVLEAALNPRPVPTIGQALRTAAAAVLCPFTILEPRQAAREALALPLLFDLAFCVLVFAGGVWYITRRNYVCTVDL